MMAELLSDPPTCFVFREPRLPLGRFILRKSGEPKAALAPLGLDLTPVAHRMAESDPDEALRIFRTFWEECEGKVGQLGVKEIMHEGWERVSAAFPDMKVVVTVRDPRDVFLSMWHKRDRLARRGRRWMEPEVLAEDVNRESRHLEAIAARHEHIVVRYEDLCRDPEWIERVRRFTGNEVTGLGLLGRTSSWNADAHGVTLGTSRVGLWQRESDPEARAWSEQARRLMAPYARAWGYAEEGGADVSPG
jgi:hypothetical protein